MKASTDDIIKNDIIKILNSHLAVAGNSDVIEDVLH